MKKTFLTILLSASLFLSLCAPAFGYTGVAPWFAADLATADEHWGIVPDSLREADLSKPISRLEFCQMTLLAYNALHEDGYHPKSKQQFSDCQDTAAAAVYELGLVDGYDDGTFQPDRLITRQEVFKMIYNLLLLDGHDQGIDPEQAGIMLSNYNDSPGASHWSAVPIATLLNLGIAQGVNDHTLGMSGNTSRLQAIALTYRYLENPVNAAARQPAIPTIPEGSSVATEFLPEPAASQDPLAASKDVLDRLGYQDEKYVLVFGSLEQPRYTSAEEAAPNMVEITVPVWALKSSGEKYATQKTLLVHNAIADRVALVFADIYAGAEQFPIKNVGGYAWRGGKSEHNWGLAIDINYEENYQIYPNGTVACGKYWLPGEDPYSIPANGDVVQAFRKHGFAWGGNAWKSNHDYMHFSYFGN